MSEDVIRRSFTVPVSAAHAFDVFTAAFAQWWPSEYTWAGDSLQWIGIEPRAGGPCFERGPHGFRCDWGRVIVWHPPRRLVFTWQVGPTRVPEPDPDRASEVDVRFTAEDDTSTRVDFEHRHLSRHGDGSVDYLAAMASPRGWDYILERYIELVR